MKTLEKANFVSTVFIGGVKKQLKEEVTWGTALTLGLYQGLKYKGNIKSGLITGVTVLGMTSAANGVYNIVYHWDKIKEALKKED